MVSPGVRFRNLEIVRPLSRGGMGELLLATTTGPGGFVKQVAIKRLHPEMAANPAVVRMFLDEARICAGLRHPNIVEIHDLGDGPDGAYIVMEYLDGQDLRGLFKRVLANRGRIPIEIAVHIIQSVCRGLHHAHERTDAAGAALNIVHRDVSPQNVFVTFEGQVKVIDFGIAKANGRLGETRTGTIKGKLGYMSPEQARGRPVDRRSDIFCAGVLLFELSTTSKLFRGSDEYELLRAVVEGNYLRPSTVVDRYPPELERIVVRALAADPADRHPTAMVLHDELEALSRREGWRVSPVDLARYLARVFARDNVDATLASPGPLDADAVVTPPPPRAAMRAAPAEPTRETMTLKAGRSSPPQGAALQSGRSRRAMWTVAALGVAACAVGAIAWSSSDASVRAHERADLPGAAEAAATAPAPASTAQQEPSDTLAPNGVSASSGKMSVSETTVPDNAMAKSATTSIPKTRGRRHRSDPAPVRTPERVPRPTSAPVVESAPTPTKPRPCASKWEPC